MASFDMPAEGSFEERGGWIVRQLMAEFGLTDAQAAGLVGNLGYESNALRTLQEMAPVVSGSRGGYGWAQWTGPRRIAFEKWCAAHSLSPSSDEANYGYLIQELRSTQAETISQLRRRTTLSGSVFSVGATFERPMGTTPSYLPAFAQRLKFAERALAGSKFITAPDDIAETVKMLQTQLQQRGYYSGAIDGDPGPHTEQAIRDWRGQR